MDFPLIYHHRPVFGLDIGRSTVKIAQLLPARTGPRVIGYGLGHFDRTATADGVIVKPELVAQSIRDVFKHSLVGRVTTNRAVVSLPIAHIYTRNLKLPQLPAEDLEQAVRLEAEQYVPLKAEETYVEHQVLDSPVGSAKTAAPAQQSVLMVAAPKKIVASYLELFRQLDLQVPLLLPNMFANLRSVDFNCHFEGAKIIIDFGAGSSDMAIYDRDPQLVGTIATGGDQITNTISKTLNLSHDQAHQLKVRYGIAKSRWQAQLASALEPILSGFANEVQKMMRYHHEHHPQHQSVGQIVLVGGGANMPGLADFLSHLTGVEVIICNPWGKLALKPLQPPALTETTLYATAVGLALAELDNV